jgi:hypothetical protein
MKHLTFKKTRPLSWSAISAFEWNKEEWWEKYVLHQDCTRDQDGLLGWCAVTESHNRSCPVVAQSKELEFGSYIDKRLQVDSEFLPHVPRYPLMQYEMKASFMNMPLIGLPDGLSFEQLTLADYKTGKKPWDQKRADETGQLTMYLLLLYLLEKVHPEEFDCIIHWLPTQANQDFSISLIDDSDLVTLHTTRTMQDVLAFGKRINTTYNLMEQYCKNHS